MDIVGIIITATASLMALLGFGSFLAIKIMKVSMKVSEDYENKTQIEEMKKAHAAEIKDLRNQVSQLADAVIDSSSQKSLSNAPEQKKE